LANATARTFLCNLLDAATSQRPKLFFSQPPLENRTGALNEQGAQVSIAAPTDAAEDRAITGRDLFRHETKPSGKVAALTKCRTVADRRHHRACRYRTDTRNAHKALAVLVLFCEFLDLSRDVGDALIEASPIVGKVFDEVDDARR
jgi:hypothetical protein